MPTVGDIIPGKNSLNTCSFSKRKKKTQPARGAWCGSLQVSVPAEWRVPARCAASLNCSSPAAGTKYRVSAGGEKREQTHGTKGPSRLSAGFDRCSGTGSIGPRQRDGARMHGARAHGGTEQQVLGKLLLPRAPQKGTGTRTGPPPHEQHPWLLSAPPPK